MRVMQILKVKLFQHFIEIEILWGSAEQKIKFWQTVVEQSVENHFPIENGNP